MKHGLLSADILYSRKMKSRNSYVRATWDTEKYKETDEAKQKTQRGSGPRSCHHLIVFQKVEAQHWGMAGVKRRGVTRSFPQLCGPVPSGRLSKEHEVLLLPGASGWEEGRRWHEQPGQAAPWQS